MRGLVGIVLVAVLVGAVTACDDDTERDPTEAAVPAIAPEGGPPPDGIVWDLGGSPATAVTTTAAGTLLVAADSPPRLLEFDPAGRELRSVALPGTAETVTTGPAGVFVSMPLVHTLMRLTPQLAPAGQIRPIAARAAVAADGTLVVARTGDVAGLRADLTPAWDRGGGIEDAARLVPTDDRVWVLDRAQSTLTAVDPRDGDVDTRLRAGRGVSELTLDRDGRVVVTDTRANELLIFGRDPTLLLQRAPVPGSPYAVAYDAGRNLAWVTLTGRNELVAFALTGGEPIEKYRFRTVHRPNSVTTVASTGVVVVGSASGAGVQVIDPGR